jgi:hypothetical protein
MAVAVPIIYMAYGAAAAAGPTAGGGWGAVVLGGAMGGAYTYATSSMKYKKEEVKKEKQEIESMGVEDAYSVDLREYKNRLLKIKNIKRMFSLLVSSVLLAQTKRYKNIKRMLSLLVKHVNAMKLNMKKSLKKRMKRLLKRLWKMITSIQCKGTGDILSSWSFETHNHFDHVYVNPSVFGFTQNNPTQNNPNPQNE